MQRSPVLVLGATGACGRHVVDFLASQPSVTVRAATRNPSSITTPTERVIPTLVDYSKPETLDAAFKGVEDFYFAQTQTPELFEEAKLVLDIGARSGAKHVVHISSNAQNAAIGKEHTEIENYAKGLGLSVTSIRPTTFMANLLDMAGSIKGKNALFLMSGPGKINWVDNRDIGEVSARALTDTSLRGRAITVAGPEVFTNQELVDHVSKVRGSTINLVEPDENGFRGALKSHGLHDVVVEKIIDMWIQIKQHSAMDVLSDDVKDITGHPPRSLDQFLADHASTFQ